VKLLVVSDTHGMSREVAKVVSRHPVEAVFHCGDFCTDRSQPPFQRMLLVRGNCDTDRTVPEERESVQGGLRIFQTHGHLYGVKQSILRLKYRAGEVGANVVLFGHSHVPTCVEDDGILFLNPGSLSSPRGYTVPTYAVLTQIGETEDEVGVEVLFHSLQGEPLSGLGGRFRLRRNKRE
jgi:putative phosphoesterase